MGFQSLNIFIIIFLIVKVLGYSPSKEEVVKMIDDADEGKKGALGKFILCNFRF